MLGRAVSYAGTTAAVAVHALFEQLWPAQAVRVALDRDYDRQVRRAAKAVEEAEFYQSRAEQLADFITAEGLAEVEEEKEVLEAGDLYGYEPPLTDDELIAVRGLIQERYQVSPDAAGDPAGVDVPPPNSPPAGISPNPPVWSQLDGGPW